MIKKIDISQLRVGMHVHELGGSWLDHSFWRSKFTLEGEEDLQALRASGVDPEEFGSLSRELGLPGEQIRQAGLAGMLHDLGKALIPLEIDLVRPGCKDKVVMGVSPADWPFKDLDALWGAPVPA